jgi:zinc protease
MKLTKKIRNIKLQLILRSFCALSLIFLLSLTTTISCSSSPNSLNHMAIIKSTSPAKQKVSRTVLKNGLTVLIKEVKTAPVVTAQVWYRVGSRDEKQGENGIVHLLEHMMFKGTKQRPIQFGRLFNALGSQSNAFTARDMTAYRGTAERNKLQALLTLEADRMQNVVIAPKELESEKNVVISEIQNKENSPNYQLNQAVMKAVFPNSTYGLPVGGTKADVEKFTVEQVQDYYRQYYSPDNATLVIVGDVDTEQTLKLVEELFGKIPVLAKEKTSTDSQQQALPATGNAKSPIVLKKPGSVKLLQAVYPLPNINHQDVPALEVMDVILTAGRSSRLYKPLIESGLAADFSGELTNNISGGWYSLVAAAAQGQEAAKMNEVIQQTLIELGNKTVTEEELKRAKTLLRASVVLSNRDITAQAMQLGRDTVTTRDYQFTERLLQAIEKVTAEDIQRVVKTYFTPDNLTLGFFEPTTQDSKTVSQPIDISTTNANTNQTTEKFNLGEAVDPAEVAKYLPPVPKNSTNKSKTLPEKIVLSNGLQVFLLQDSSTPTVTLTGFIDEAGSKYNPKDKAGLAEVTVSNLVNGTQTKDALTLTKTLEERAISISFNPDTEGTLVTGISLGEELPTLIENVADMLQNPAFPEKELELSRKQTLTGLQAAMSDPQVLASRVLQQTIYPPNHPSSNLATEESVKNISRQDLINFHKTHYRPDTTVLTLVGNFDLTQVKSLLEQKFDSWKVSGKPLASTLPEIPLPQKIVRKNLQLPGIPQSITSMAHVGVARRDPRYPAALVLNQILGGSTDARLGIQIRDRLGLTYGIYSSFTAEQEQGLFSISVQSAPKDTQKVVDTTLKIIEQLRNEGVSEHEVQLAKQEITSEYILGLANPDNLSGVITLNQVNGLKLRELNEYLQKIEAVTPAQVNEAAKELLHPNQLTIVTAGS